ncbi:MAG TPA: UDP-N-acetylmuramoyl-tripeptide--D-alanyl-D-alanine ligase, partial [Armatimonadota bacterium]|nr:UDP-N-acetylmuramoyl-tripeptide--D-alanyl-D-alanine ligase [Armatimonadota bacterium]
MTLPLARIAAAMNADGEFDGSAIAQGYSIDTRSLQQGDLFFAVKGERLDGHDFVDQALEKGAVAAVIAREHLSRFSNRSRLLVVDEPLAAMQRLGAAVRALWNKPLVAITGSAGKTTTKEITARLLATRFCVIKTERNLNNHFGLPLQLLRLEPEHDIAVIEMGMSHPGEITALAALARPNVGAITNVAPVHLGFFKSVAEIARAKQELIGQIAPDGTAVLNADDEYVSQFGREFQGRVVTYAVRNPADVHAESVEQHGSEGSRFDVVIGDERFPATLPLIGMHNVYNALAAVAIATQCGIRPAAAVAELANLVAVEKRGQVIEIGGATVVNDCYNSNPRALDSMVDALAGMQPGPNGRRIVVAGEMLELGPAGEDLHRRCGQHMADRGMDVVIGVRGLARFIVEAAKAAPPLTAVWRSISKSGAIAAEFLETPELAGEWLAREARPGDLVLLKGSRGVRLE